MDSKPRAERPCIFFLMTVIVGCAIVAAITCEAVHLFLQLPNWHMYLGVAVGVAALVAGVNKLMHFMSHRSESHRHSTPIAH